MSLAILALAAIAAVETVGIATTDGSFRVGGIAVPGTSSLTDGATVETEARPARVQLRSGATIELGAQSRARVHSDRLYLEAGSSTVTGRMNVLTAQGVLVARTANGPVAFHVPPAPSSAAELTGIIESKDGVLVIHDEASRLTFPLDAAGEMGDKLTQSIGSKATIKGVLQAGRVQVSSVELVGATAGAAGATTAAATTATTASTTAGTAAASTAAVAGVSKAVIAGVAIAGAAATGATVGFVQSQSQPAATVSQ